MVDYSAWKVVDLKAELKNREVPQTGLRVKQQFIDKLEELDSQTGQTEPAASAVEEEETSATAPPGPDATSQAPVLEPEQSQPDEPKEEPSAPEPMPDKAVDSKNETEDLAQQHADTVTSAEPERVENDTKPIGEATTSDNAPQKEKSPAAEAPSAPSPADAKIEDPKTKTEDYVKPQEKSTPPALPSPGTNTDVNTELSTPLPTEEALEDTRKRKRRSQSPAPTLEEIANRKARAEEAVPHVLMKDDKGYDDQKPTENTTSESLNDNVLAEQQAPSPKATGKQDARFRGLFASRNEPPRPPSPSQDIVMQDADAGPALHAATSALYIDGLMRPLQPTALRKHLSTLASAPETSSDSDPIIEFYLDSIKTHCFVRFTSTVAASRVRSALHGTVWPNERNRKQLRADFIPDDKVKEWIQTEEDSQTRSGPATRWEVRYETSDDGTTATLAEVGSGAAVRRESGFNRTPPLGPRSDRERANRRHSPPPPAPAPRPGQGFKPLDELFESTTSKPKLYYLPVPRPVADKRLDQFDELIRKGAFPRRGGDEMRRITFENEDQFVDIGPEKMAPSSRPGAGRGRGRGGRRGDWR
ncbi:DNA-binding SAP [Penicillium brevicompactum]|uniref:DNA-binding SAP n=1 Tax=Penicillium brevicompactum TaxID=5074 RepID=A0A9W9QT95_PENBR|nr:DNA-binding SAP [Penicillium brevicompactum]